MNGKFPKNEKYVNVIPYALFYSSAKIYIKPQPQHKKNIWSPCIVLRLAIDGYCLFVGHDKDVVAGYLVYSLQIYITKA